MRNPKKTYAVSIIRMEDDTYEVNARDQKAAEEKAKKLWEEEHPWCGEPWSVDVEEMTL